MWCGYLTVLIYISLRTNEHFSWAYWPFNLGIWRADCVFIVKNPCKSRPAQFKPMLFKGQPYLICKYFLPVWAVLSLSFEAHFLKILQAKLIFFLITCAFGIISKNHCLTQGHNVLSWSPLRVLVLTLTLLNLGPWSILNLFLYIVWGCGPNLFFCMWIPSCTNSICWKDCSPPVNCLGPFVENQLTINVRVYFWTLNSSLFHWFQIAIY